MMLEPRQVLDRYYPEVRAWLIQIAAVMDRYERAGGGDGDERLRQYREALKVLQSPGDDRAERIQVIYSDPYEGSGAEGRGPRGPTPVSLGPGP
jgi:hypothetical protein